MPKIQFGVIFQCLYGAILLRRRCEVCWNILSPPPTLDLNSIGRRGEVKLLLVNLAATPYHVSTANPIAQVIVLPYMAALFREVPLLSGTIRGTMTFERTQQHVASSAPSGPQSPLMSPHSLFGEIFPRYICFECHIS